MGVYDRILAIGDFFDGRHPLDRPAYNYRVPLKDIPGVGPKTLSRLNRFFRNEIELVENADLTLVAKTVGNEIAEMIGQMRNGRLDIVPEGEDTMAR
jgi:PHP family Zn ribbon phosphoesterase